MDKTHAKMVKQGVNRLLFMPIGDRGVLGEQMTTLFWRLVEDRILVLFPVSMNTQGQSVRGATTVDVVT